MKQLASVRFGAQTAEEILAYLSKSAQSVSSEKITQGIAISILDGKRPENSGTLMKYIRAKCDVEITPHAFSVAVAFASLNGTGVGHVEEDKFVLVPLNWHLHASTIINIVAKPETGLDDAARAGVHEEIAEIFRTKPEKGEDLLKLIKARYKAPSKKGEGEGDGEGDDKQLVVEAVPVDALSDAYLKEIGFQAADCQDAAKVTRVAQLMDYIRTNVIGAKLAELGVTEITAIEAAPVAVSETPVATPEAATLAA